MKQQTKQEKILKERMNTRIENSTMLYCQSCHSEVDSLLEVEFFIPNRIKQKKEVKKLCFHCIRKYKIYVSWKGSYWKEIFNIIE